MFSRLGERERERWEGCKTVTVGGEGTVIPGIVPPGIIPPGSTPPGIIPGITPPTG